MASKFKIALIQLHPKPLAPAENFARAEAFIRSAAGQGCRLAVLPEYHLTSWVPDDERFAAVCADSAPVYLQRYRDLARELAICIVPGTIVEAGAPGGESAPVQGAPTTTPTTATASTTDGPDPEGDKHRRLSNLHNVAYFLSPEGAVLGSYQKKNLWHPERRHLVSSAHEPHSAFDVPLPPGGSLRAGLLVCWDLAFPEAFRALAADGAQLIIVPTFWSLRDVSDEGYALNPLGEAVFLDSAVACRAFENTCAVVFVNAGGPPSRQNPEDTSFAGLSQLGVPHLGSLGRMGRAEGMSVVELDPDVLRVAEDNYRVREDMRHEHWHYGPTQMRGPGKL